MEHQEGQLYQYDICIWYMSLYVGDRVVCRFRWNIRRVNCINTTSGICHCMQVTVWYVGLDGTSGESIVSIRPLVYVTVCR